MKEKETILELYENFIDEIYERTSKNLVITKEIVNQQEKINKTLTEEQKKLLEKISILENQKTEETYKEIFTFAFSLATKLFVEGIKPDIEKDT